MNSTTAEKLIFVLLHGAWHDGSTFDAVADHLRTAGHEVHAPTIAGHGPDADSSATLEDAVNSVVGYIKDNDLSEIVLLGWSYGGLVMSLAAPVVRERVARMVFHDAFIMENGRRMRDAMPDPMVGLLLSLTDADGRVMLPFEFFRDSFCGTATYEQARDIYDHRLHPQIVRVVQTPVDTTAFDAMLAEGFPTSFVHGTGDVALPPGESNWYPRFAKRLGTPRVTLIQGADHEAPLTAPRATAEAYVIAGRR